MILTAIITYDYLSARMLHDPHGHLFYLQVAADKSLAICCFLNKKFLLSCLLTVPVLKMKNLSLYVNDCNDCGS